MTMKSAQGVTCCGHCYCNVGCDLLSWRFQDQ